MNSLPAHDAETARAAETAAADIEDALAPPEAVVSIPAPPVRSPVRFLTPVAAFTLLIALHVTITTFIGAITGEKTIFLYKEQLHLSASGLSTLQLVLDIPAYIQPFLGGWTDIVPLFGYHRRSYYILGALGLMCAYAGLALMPSYHLWSVACLLILSGAFSIFATVVTNAVMVTVGNRTGNFGRFQSLVVFIPYILRLSYTSHFGGYVAQNWTYAQAYSTAAVLALLYLPLVFLMEDRRVSKTAKAAETAEAAAERQREQAANKAKLRQAAKSPQLWVMVAYVAYLIITPTPNSTYYFKDGLHLSKQLIGDNGRWNAIGALSGMGLFALGSRRLPVFALAAGAWLMDCAAYPGFYFMRDSVSVHLFSVLVYCALTIYGLCLNTIAARASPPGIEAAAYGLVMAAIVFAGNLSNLLGNWIYDFFGPANHHSVTYGWNAAILFGLLFTLPAGLLIPFLPAELKSRKPLQTKKETGETAAP